MTLDVDEQDEARIAERQKLVDEHVAAYEKEMNSYGLSFERSREIITRYASVGLFCSLIGLFCSFIGLF